jgi:hypothetical protein
MTANMNNLLLAWTLYSATVRFQEVNSRLGCVWRGNHWIVFYLSNTGDAWLVTTAIERSTRPYLWALMIRQHVRRWQHSLCMRIGIFVTEISTCVSVNETVTIRGTKTIVVNGPCSNVCRPQQCIGLAAVCRRLSNLSVCVCLESSRS